MGLSKEKRNVRHDCLIHIDQFLEHLGTWDYDDLSKTAKVAGEAVSEYLLDLLNWAY